MKKAMTIVALGIFAFLGVAMVGGNAYSDDDPGKCKSRCWENKEMCEKRCLTLQCRNECGTTYDQCVAGCH